MAKDDALLKRIFKDGAVGEKRKEWEENQKREEEERQRAEKERIRTFGEVRALFDEAGELYGKKLYRARAGELLKYLKTKKHAVTFWNNPHVKMIYNIADHNNFLLSIYAEETDNRKYEEWLREHFSNPFVNHLAVNYEMVVKKYLRYDDNYGIEKELISTCRTVNNLNNDNRNGYDDLCLFTRFIYSGATYRGAVNLGTYHELSKPISDEDLLDSDAYNHLLSIRNFDEPIRIINPLVATDNNFLRIDTYNAWRTKCRNEWREVFQRNPEMFAILDALVKSRKIYLKERKN